jgi:hypothetical protein
VSPSPPSSSSSFPPSSEACNSGGHRPVREAIPNPRCNQARGERRW